MDDDSGFVVFSVINESGDILNKCQNSLFGSKVNNTLEIYW